MAEESDNSTPSRAVVTLSASYGAGGSVVGPLVAERLGVPFLDRAIPSAAAERLGATLEEALAHEQPQTGLGRLLSAFSTIPSIVGTEVVVQGSERVEEHRFKVQTEEVVKEMARTTGGVILGRAGALVLRDSPGALHVRLDGPPDARIRQAMEIEDLDRQEAERRMRENDWARVAYVRHFYGANPEDPRLYHLVVDSTALALEACVDLIVRASQVGPRRLVP